MRYEDLDKEDFDAIVTGELTHYAIWMEDKINSLITDYFVSDKSKSKDFRRLFLYRDGLTFQDKLEIARGMIPLLGLNDQDQTLLPRTIGNAVATCHHGVTQWLMVWIDARRLQTVIHCVESVEKVPKQILG